MKKKKKRFKILNNSQDCFSVKIFQGYNISCVFPLIILGLIAFLGPLGIITNLTSDLKQEFGFILIVSVLVLFLMIYLFLDNGMLFYVLIIDKKSKTIRLLKDFVLFCLKKGIYSIDNVREIRVDNITWSDGFYSNNSYSLKLIFKSGKEIKIYDNSIMYLKPNQIDIVKKEINELRLILCDQIKIYSN